MNSHWDSPAQILDTCANQYAIDKWQNQKHYIEVWVEKEALMGVVEKVSKELDLTCFSCRGYSSQSAMWRAGMRMILQEREDKETVVLYLGDHDPSGINMTSDIRSRLMMFGARTQVDRIALTMDQIRELSPPPNPAKQTDSRFTEYQAKYGGECWELDALEPAYIENLVRDKVYELRDVDLWQEMLEKEATEKAKLKALVKNLEE